MRRAWQEGSNRKFRSESRAGGERRFPPGPAKERGTGEMKGGTAIPWRGRGWAVLGLWAVGIGFVHPAGAGGRVALTFDDGPCPFFTQPALDLLEQYGAQATFFYVGQRLARAPYLAPLVVARGHEVENHTFGHKNLTQLTPSQVRDQILWTAILIARQTGVWPRYVRPPYNALNEATREVGQGLGMKFVSWTIDPRDWQKGRTKDQIVRHVMGRVQDGSIILLHETRRTLEALPALLEQLHRAGFRMVTLAELWNEAVPGKPGMRGQPAPQSPAGRPQFPGSSGPLLLRSGSLGPFRPAVWIHCGKGGRDEAVLAPGYGYELLLGSRAEVGRGPRPGWAWQGEGEVRFHLQVPPGIQGALSLYLQPDAGTWRSQELWINQRSVGRFRGSRWVRVALDKSLTTAGTLLVRLWGGRDLVRICEVILEVGEALLPAGPPRPGRLPGP